MIEPAHRSGLSELLRQGPERIPEILALTYHQGTVYPETAAAVPALFAMTGVPSEHRTHLAWMLGIMADPRHSDGDAFDDVRAAVLAQGPLPLDDPDPEMRSAAAYLTALAGGPVTVLRDRLTIEYHPSVRATLHHAISYLDPDSVAAAFPFDGEPDARLAAGLALIRSGHPLPAGAAAAIATAVADGVVPEWAWLQGEPVDALVLAADDDTAADLVAALAASPDPATRQACAFVVSERAFAEEKPAVFTDLVPLIAPLTDDPDPSVRAEARSTLLACGPATGDFRAAITVLAERYPEVAGSRAITRERRAVETLMWLGDPRWVDLGPDLASPRRATFTPEVLGAVRGRLARHTGLIDVVASWGPRAADAVPDLIALLPETGSIAARALARIGHAGPDTLPYLWGIAEDGDIDAAAAIRRLTGDPRLLLAALDSAFGAVGKSGLGALIPPRPPYPVRPPLLDAGADLMPVLPAAQSCLTGDPMHGPDRRTQILAAVVTMAATGDSAVALPTLWALLSAVSSEDIVDVATLLADLLGPDPALIARIDELIGSGRLLGVAADAVGQDEAIRRRLRDLRQGLT